MKYQRGPIITDKVWHKPTKSAILAWYEDMKLVIERSGYTAYLVGRCVNDIEQTADVDIVYIGTLKPDTLEQLLITSITAGLRHNILVDARWQSDISTVEFKDDKIAVLPTQFIFLNYFEQDDQRGHKVINDFRLNPLYKAVNDNLVYSTFDRVAPRLKPHQVNCLYKQGKLDSILLTEYKE